MSKLKQSMELSRYSRFINHFITTYVHAAFVGLIVFSYICSSQNKMKLLFNIVLASYV